MSEVILAQPSDRPVVPILPLTDAELAGYL